MVRLIGAAGLVLLLAAPALGQSAAASGDAGAGGALFGECQSCHVLVNEAGEALAGRRSARTGPNLYGVAGRQAGIVPGFRYGDDLVRAGERGLAWDERNFVAYVQDPTEHLRAFLGDPKARGRMTYRMRSEAEAIDLFAFLASLAPAPVAVPFD